MSRGSPCFVAADEDAAVPQFHVPEVFGKLVFADGKK